MGEASVGRVDCRRRPGNWFLAHGLGFKLVRGVTTENIKPGLVEEGPRGVECEDGVGQAARWCPNKSEETGRVELA